ncbi:hypothetical protein I302_104585 [Kwoniella bestiolae CBS 10118]|uniref:Uncharacterized protein n=1 Tax=Kwoniella bestiolae CBS 10118 TaxID=1296100 RepID=A0A1B9GBN5_9TREE|nr:hypothetical protein I302_03291 [Kwoniella bestiolae CBS 10118]OCF28432.1 hypothetical protein I302_03291 [Kwoniella bestiolae CBS 10118]
MDPSTTTRGTDTEQGTELPAYTATATNTSTNTVSPATQRRAGRYGLKVLTGLTFVAAGSLVANVVLGVLNTTYKGESIHDRAQRFACEEANSILRERTAELEESIRSYRSDLGETSTATSEFPAITSGDIASAASPDTPTVMVTITTDLSGDGQMTGEPNIVVTPSAQLR